MVVAAVQLKVQTEAVVLMSLGFWMFLAFVFLNSLYPGILLIYPSAAQMRLHAAAADAIFDGAYTVSYLVVSLVALQHLHTAKAIEGNFAGYSRAELTTAIDQHFAFPDDCVNYLAIYMSIAHIACVCRALERVAAEARAFCCCKTKVWSSL